MITETLKAAIRTAYKTLTEQAGFRSRLGQRQMIGLVANTLAAVKAEGEPNIAVVQGPTGTGKSAAYLLPAVVLGKQLELPVVVSTATVALQEQLVEKDIPRLLTTLGEKLTVRVAKGRGRYLCPRDLDKTGDGNPDQYDLGFTSEEVADAAETDGAPSSDDRAFIETMSRRWNQRSWDGDLDTYPEPIPVAVRERVTTTHAACSGQRCPQRSTCPWLKAREDLKTAGIVVTNHARLLTHLTQVVKGSTLPSLDKCLLVIDEGHHLPEIAKGAFAADMGLREAGTMIRRGAALARALNGAVPVSDRKEDDLADALEAVAAARAQHKALEQTLKAWTAATAPFSSTRDGRGVAIEQFLVHGGQLPTDVIEPLLRLTRSLGDVGTFIRKLVRRVFNKARPTDAVVAAVREAGRLVELGESAVTLNKAFSSRRGDMALWVQSSRHDRSIHAAPLFAHDLLAEHLFEPARAVVVTSATLGAEQGFGPIMGALGLGGDLCKQVNTLMLPSPFDLAGRSGLVVPEGLPSPKGNGEAHLAAVVDQIRTRSQEGVGTLALFASRKSMLAAAKALSGVDGVRHQDEGSKTELLAAHAESVRAGEMAILLGVAGFAEGLDLPGDLCGLLVIDKLPFPTPFEPIEAALDQWYQANKRSYFGERSLPLCLLRLTQSIGRLMRTEDDTGQIVLCDPRLVQTSWGRRLLGQLPDHFRGEIQNRHLTGAQVRGKQPHVCL